MDNNDLRERVAELEATIEAQQATIETMMPSRRSVLAGMAGVGAGSLGARLFTDSARGQAVGQIGNDADRVDVFAASISAGEASVGTLEADNVKEGTVRRVQTLAGSPDGSHDSSEFADVDVSFDEPFDSAPVVIADLNSRQTSIDRAISANHRGVTESGFSIRFRNLGTDDSSQQQAAWIAISA